MKTTTKLSRLMLLVLSMNILPQIAQAQVGSSDPSFNAFDTDSVCGFKGTDGSVRKAVMQSDGKLILCGNFTTVNGKVANGIARLKANGKWDATFNPGSGANDEIT